MRDHTMFSALDPIPMKLGAKVQKPATYTDEHSFTVAHITEADCRQKAEAEADADGWIECGRHTVCPLAETAPVEVRFANGRTTVLQAGVWAWGWDNERPVQYEIVAYRPL